MSRILVRNPRVGASEKVVQSHWGRAPIVYLDVGYDGAVDRIVFDDADEARRVASKIKKWADLVSPPARKKAA